MNFVRRVKDRNVAIHGPPYACSFEACYLLIVRYAIRRVSISAGIVRSDTRMIRPSVTDFSIGCRRRRKKSRERRASWQSTRRRFARWRTGNCGCNRGNQGWGGCRSMDRLDERRMFIQAYRRSSESDIRRQISSSDLSLLAACRDAPSGFERTSSSILEMLGVHAACQGLWHGSVIAEALWITTILCSS